MGPQVPSGKRVGSDEGRDEELRAWDASHQAGDHENITIVNDPSERAEEMDKRLGEDLGATVIIDLRVKALEDMLELATKNTTDAMRRSGNRS